MIVLPRIRGTVDGDTNAALAVGSTLALRALRPAAHRGGPVRCDDDDRRQRARLRRRLRPLRGQADRPGPTRTSRACTPSTGSTGPPRAGSSSPPRRSREWERSSRVLERPDLAIDERFATVASRREHDDALRRVARASSSPPATADWEDAARRRRRGVRRGLRGSQSEFTCTDPVLRETGLVVEERAPRVRAAAAPRVAGRLSETPGRLGRCCLLGEQTEVILTELGYSDDEIDDLVDRKVVLRA